MMYRGFKILNRGGFYYAARPNGELISESLITENACRLFIDNFLDDEK